MAYQLLMNNWPVLMLFFCVFSQQKAYANNTSQPLIGQVQCGNILTLVSYATLPSSKYFMNASRNLDSVLSQLPPKIRDKIQSMRNETVYDFGGGYSLYGLQLAREGNQVLTISQHDLYREVMTLLTNPDQQREFNRQFREDWVFKILHPFHRVLDPEGPPLLNGNETHESITRRAQLAKKILDIVESTPLLERRIDHVQNVLPQLPDNSAMLGLDIYGSFTYSGGRLFLISDQLAKIKVGGYLIIKTEFLQDKWDQVLAYRYLARRYPHVEHIADTGLILIIQKQQDDPLLNIRSEVDLVREEASNLSLLGPPLIIPSSTYETKRP